MTNYPTLRIDVLRALQNRKRHYSADNEIFDRDDCPYDMDVRAVLKEILTVEVRIEEKIVEKRVVNDGSAARKGKAAGLRSEEHTSELQSLMRISYAVFCLKKKQHTSNTKTLITTESQKH